MNGFTFYRKVNVVASPADFMQDLYCFEYHSKAKAMIVYWSPIGEVTRSVSINGQSMSLDFLRILSFGIIVTRSIVRKK